MKNRVFRLRLTKLCRMKGLLNYFVLGFESNRLPKTMTEEKSILIDQALEVNIHVLQILASLCIQPKYLVAGIIPETIYAALIHQY